MIALIIQKYNSENRQNVNLLIQQQCIKDNVSCYEIDIVPFERSIIGYISNDLDKVIVYGSTAFYDVVKNNNWSPGIFSIDDEQTVLEKIKEHYLNSDMKTLSISDGLEYVKNYDENYFFAKPSDDNKMFDGGIFDKSRFPFYIENISQYNNFNPNTKICISSLKYPEKEWRIFIVNGKVCTYSQYRENRKLVQSTHIDKCALDLVENLISFYNPAFSYVIDVCLINNDYKVVEYNTMNFSGMYMCNVNKIVEEINKGFK